MPQLFQPVRQGRFRTLWAGQSLALLGAEFHLVALAWLALELTGSGLALGSVLVAGLLPRIVFTLVGGVAADRFPVAHMLVLGNLLRAAVVGGFTVVVALDQARLWQLYLVGAVLGAITSFYRPALYAAVPRIVEQETLRPANALMRGTGEAVGMIGPVAAGLLIAVTDTSAAFAVTTGCYLIAAMALAGLWRSSLGVGRQRDGSPQGTLMALRAGASTVRQDKALLRVLLLISAAGLALTGPITVGVPWLASERFAANAAAFGLMLSMWTTGSLLGTVIGGGLKGLPGWRPLLLSVGGLIGAALVTLGFAPNAVVAAVALLAMGAAAGFFNVIVLTWLQERTEQDKLGRLMSLVELAEVVTTPASFLLAGIFLEISVPAVFITAAVLFTVSALVVATRIERPAVAGS